MEIPDNKLWQIYKCKSCDHGFVNPQPSFEELSDYYHAGYGPFAPDNEGNISEHANKANETGEHRHIKITPEMDILDVGCGGGGFLTVAKALGANVKGIEPSEHAYKACVDAGLDVCVCCAC